MNININVVRRPVLGTNRTQFKYYGHVKSKGQVSLDDLATQIAAMCTVTRHDIVAVLAALQREALDILKNGDGVSLGELGTLYVHCSSVMKINAEDLTVDRVKRIYPCFTASAKLRHCVGKDKVQFNINRPADVPAQAPAA